MKSPSLHAVSKMYMFQVQLDPLKHSFGMLQRAKSWSTLHRKLSNCSSMTVNLSQIRFYDTETEFL